MDLFLELILEILLECLFEGIIPASIPNYTDNRKKRISKAVVAIIIFIFMIIWAAAIVKINSDYRAIMIGIFLLISFSLTIVLIFLRAKAIKFSILYSLNFVLIVLVTGMGIAEAITLIITMDKKYPGILALIAVILVSIIAGLYTIYKINKYRYEDEKVNEFINKKEYKDPLILALDRYKVVMIDGHLAYYNLVHGHLDELMLIKDEIPKILYDTTKRSFKLIEEGSNESAINRNDSFVKLYKKNIDRYIYREIYIKYYYRIAKKFTPKKLHDIIKDEIYEYNGELLTRLTVRGIVKYNNKYALLKIETSDEFGKRNHYETPGGGLLEGETLEATLRREMMEELGCEINNIRQLGYVDIEYNLINRLDRCIFYSCDALSISNTSWSENEKRLIKEIVWLTKEEIIDIYDNFDVENVGKMIHERDGSVFNYYFRKR